MESSLSDCTLPMDNCEMALHEIERGHDLLSKLKDLTEESPIAGGGGGIVRAGDLVDEVLGSLTGALSMLSRATSTDVLELDQEISTDGDEKIIRSPPAHDGFSSPERNPTCGEKKDRHTMKRYTGGKRSRRYPQYDRKLTKKPHDDDGYVWKKYGQKIILGAEHRRCYYKCSQKTDQGCPATKQVQRSNQDPSVFVVSYIGKHCCQPAIYLSDDARSPNPPFSITFGKSFDSSVTTNHSPLPLTNRLEQPENLSSLPHTITPSAGFPSGCFNNIDGLQDTECNNSLNSKDIIIINSNNSSFDGARHELPDVCPTDVTEQHVFEAAESSGNPSYTLDHLFDDISDFDFKSFWSENEDLLK